MPDISHDSLDIAIAALDDKARAGWAKAFDLERKLSEMQAERDKAIADGKESARTSGFMRGVLDHFAPALAPWLRGEDPGLGTFRGLLLTESNDPRVCRGVGRAAAQVWQRMSPEAKRDLNWRAEQLNQWYCDPDAKMPMCACGRVEWDHSGPDEPCLSEPRPTT